MFLGDFENPFVCFNSFLFDLLAKYKEVKLMKDTLPRMISLHQEITQLVITFSITLSSC